MSLHRAPRLALALAFPIALLPLACGNSGGETSPAGTATAEAVKPPVATAAPTAATTAQSAVEHGREHGRARRGGIAGMMLSAAHDLTLKDAQQTTVAKLTEQLHAGGEAPSGEGKAYHTALAAQVRAGKIDTAKLDVLQAAMDKGMQAHKDKEAEALNGLYAALEPAQRKALVAAVRAKQAERAAKSEHKAEVAKLTDADRAKRRLDHLTKQLGLDAAQQKSVAAALAKAPPPAGGDTGREEMKKHGDAVLTAFEADGFDAKKLEAAPAAPTAPTTAKKPLGPMAEHAQLLAILVPLLKPEQREKLAAGMEKQGGRRGEGEEGGEGPGADEAPAADAPSAP